MVNPSKQQEQDWLRGLSMGDKRSLQHIFNSYYGYLLNVGYKLIKDQEQVKDIAQEVFFELWKKREHLTITSSLKSYLHRSMVNRSLNYIKKQKRFSFGDDTIPVDIDVAPNPQQLVETSDLETAIREAIDNLPERCRLIFSMSRFENLSHKEIAKRLNISTKTIENQMTKALKAIRLVVSKMGYLLLLLGLLP